MLSTVVISLLVLFSSVVIVRSKDQKDPVRYDHFALYRVWCEESPLNIQDDFHGGLILSQPNVQSPSYDILIPPQNQLAFETDLNSRQWSFELLNKNVQETIDKERLLNRVDLQTGGPYNWDRYQSYEEIVAWMQGLPNQYPGNVTLFNIGKSYEGRDTYVVRLSQRENNTAIFLEAGIHAREWITVATSTWIFNELLTSTDPGVVALALKYDWYLLPVGNPDGYAYTFSTDRLWRKNRRPFLLSPLLPQCKGVDLNRNWNYHWRETDLILGILPVTSPCSETYPGRSAMSEVETKNLDNFIGPLVTRTKLYISFHSYSQVLLWPEGHTATRIPEYNNYELIGNATVEAIQIKYGTMYEQGSVYEAMYAASGSTIDYMRGRRGIPLAFCFELRPGRDATMGFILDPLQINSTSEETFDGIQAMIREGHALGYLSLPH